MFGKNDLFLQKMKFSSADALGKYDISWGIKSSYSGNKCILVNSSTNRTRKSHAKSILLQKLKRIF